MEFDMDYSMRDIFRGRLHLHMEKWRIVLNCA